MPNFTIVIAAMQPANATVEPTERSKPPPMMTKVMPMAITAMIEDCTRMLVRLSGDRKRLVNSAVMTHSASSVMSGICPTRLNRLCHRQPPMAACSRCSSKPSARSIRSMIAPWCIAQMLSQRRVISARSLDDDQHAAAALGEVADQRVDLRLGGDVDALRRLVEQQHADLARQPFGEDDLLLVAAGQRAGRQRRIARPDVERFHQFATPRRRRRHGRAVRRACRRSRLGSRMLSRTERFITRPSRRSPGTMPMPERWRRSARRSPGPAITRTLRCGVEAEQPPQHAAGAAAEQAGEPDDLSGAQADRVRPSLGIFKDDLARAAGIGRDSAVGAAGHGLHQIADGERAAPAHRRNLAVAQHGAAVGQRHHLVEPVRDVDDRGALRFHPRQHREQPLDLAGLQRRGRLVENQQPAALAQRLGDGDELAFGKTQAVDADVGIGRKVELRQRAPRLLRASPRGRPAACRAHETHRRIVERQVFRNRERGNEAQLLRNGGDARVDRIVRIAEMTRLAIDRDLAGVRPVHAAEDADQRRFSGAVLADQRVDFARHHVEIDVVQRARRAEVLADAARACRRGGHAPDARLARDAHDAHLVVGESARAR